MTTARRVTGPMVESPRATARRGDRPYGDRPHGGKPGDGRRYFEKDSGRPRREDGRYGKGPGPRPSNAPERPVPPAVFEEGGAPRYGKAAQGADRPSAALRKTGARFGPLRAALWQSLASIRTAPRRAMGNRRTIRTVLRRATAGPSRIPTVPRRAMASPSRIRTAPLRATAGPSRIPTGPRRATASPLKIPTALRRATAGPSENSDRPAPRYGRPVENSDRPTPRYGKPVENSDRPAPRYGRPAPRFDKPAPKFDRPGTRYGHPAPEDQAAPVPPAVPVSPETSESEGEGMDNLLVGRNPIREALKAGVPIEKMLVAQGELSGSAQGDCGQGPGCGHRGAVRRSRAPRRGLFPTIRACWPTRRRRPIRRWRTSWRWPQSKDEAPFVVVLDGVTDPHNLGAIIRTAECCGAHGVIVPERRSAGLSPAAVKASAGALSYLPVARVGNLSRTLAELKEEGLWVIGCDMSGGDIRQSRPFRPGGAGGGLRGRGHLAPGAGGLRQGGFRSR